MNKSGNVKTQGKGGHCPALGFGVPVAFLLCQFGGEEFFLESTEPNVSGWYNSYREDERG